MPEHRLRESISIVSSRIATILLAALIISSVSSLLFFLLFLIFGNPLVQDILFPVVLVFASSFISTLLVKTESFIALKNGTKYKPPLRAVFIFIASYCILFWLLPETFMESSKKSPIILILLLIPNLALSVGLHAALYFLFINVLRFFTLFRSKELLNENAFLEQTNNKINEIHQYGGTFTFIMITLTIPNFALPRLKQSHVITLFFELIKKSIRNTDLLGICGSGDIAVILSNNNNLEKAQIQSRRIVTALEKNMLLMEKIKAYNAEISIAMHEYEPGIVQGNLLLAKTIKKITDDQMAYWTRLAGKREAT